MLKYTLATGILFVLISIVFNALGSHAIKATLEAREATDSFQIACNFTMYHGLGLILLGIMMHVFPHINFNLVFAAFVLGSVFFQGVIFTKSFVDVGKLGVLNPIGGSILMLGWLYFLFLVLKNIR
jgi:uncharacterized membrane protein YgdD (TMEM256/DUF423 family)